MNIFRFKELSSTQDYAKKLEIPPPFVVIAKTQFKGRGKFKRIWYSPKGGLWFTLVQKNSESIPVSLLPLVVSLSIKETLSKQGMNINIRFPNDLCMNGGKIGGVLVEKWKNKIGIGIGINLNVYDIPLWLENKATSVALETGKELSIENIFQNILEDLTETLKKFEAEGSKYFQKRIIPQINGFNKKVIIETQKGKREGLIEVIDEAGNIVILSEFGYPMIIPLRDVIGIYELSSLDR